MARKLALALIAFCAVQSAVNNDVSDLSDIMEAVVRLCERSEA
jgi:hypothetical protein